MLGVLSLSAMLTAFIYVQGKEERMIREVLALQFDANDNHFIELLWNPENRIVKDGVETNPEFAKYAEEKYGEYFTESELDTFMRTFATTYPSLADSGGYTLSLKELTVEESENTKNRFTFTASVGYKKKDGKELVKDVEGLILFSTTEGKIGKFQYFNDNGLTMALQSSS